ncbi:hypothetical protein HYQ46_005963 [Verticillium longisporum]|nr:hypothetical protein HYQ46_005963 [Verticillium longisporum]
MEGIVDKGVRLGVSFPLTGGFDLVSGRVQRGQPAGSGYGVASAEELAQLGVGARTGNGRFGLGVGHTEDKEGAVRVRRLVEGETAGRDRKGSFDSGRGRTQGRERDVKWQGGVKIRGQERMQPDALLAVRIKA